MSQFKNIGRYILGRAFKAHESCVDNVGYDLVRKVGGVLKIGRLVEWENAGLDSCNASCWE